MMNPNIPKTTVLYYINSSGENPVKKFIETLLERQQRKLTRVLKYIEEYGLIAAIPHIKKLTGTSFWEIRILGQDNIRVLYASVYAKSILLLHGFVKKSKITPRKEIEIALNRLTDWINYQKNLDK